jgi:dynein heavy chain 2
LRPIIAGVVFQLFNLLGLKTNGPNAVSKETVTLAHFLDVADAVVKNADSIKSLDAQAQVCARDMGAA